MDILLEDAKTRKAEELLQEFVRRKPGAVKLIDKLLAGAGVEHRSPHRPDPDRA